MYYQQPMYQPVYPQYYYPTVPVSQPQPQMQMQPQIQQNQPVQAPAQEIRKSPTMIPVQNKEEAQKYPVAPGNSVDFKDENAPYIYTKTMGFSQFDTPTFEIIRLVKEDEVVDQSSNNEIENNTQIVPVIDDRKYVDESVIININNTLSELDEEMKNAMDDIADLRIRVEEIGKRRSRTTKKVGESDGE